jgi:hypothetical protein
MSQTRVPVHSPAPAPQGPVACTLSPNEYARRLDDFRHGVFNHLAEMERPEPTRLRLTLTGDADPAAVRALLVREQSCCAFMSFTLTPSDSQLVADLEVPTEAAPTLDALAMLAELATPRGGPMTRAG